MVLNRSLAPDTERSQCTDKTCTGEAKYALWIGDQFSRVRDAHPAMSYSDGDLHPHVCETCLPRYKSHHGDKGEFVQPVEKLIADGGQSSVGTERSLQERIEDEMVVDPDRYFLCVSCGQLKHEELFVGGACTCDICHEAGQYSVNWKEAPDGDGYLYCADANQQKPKPCADANALIYEDEYLTIQNHPMAPEAVSVQVGDQSPTITDARDVFEAHGAFLRLVEPETERSGEGDR